MSNKLTDSMISTSYNSTAVNCIIMADSLTGSVIFYVISIITCSIIEL